MLASARVRLPRLLGAWEGLQWGGAEAGVLECPLLHRLFPSPPRPPSWAAQGVGVLRELRVGVFLMHLILYVLPTSWPLPSRVPLCREPLVLWEGEGCCHGEGA